MSGKETVQEAFARHELALTSESQHLEYMTARCQALIAEVRRTTPTLADEAKFRSMVFDLDAVEQIWHQRGATIDGSAIGSQLGKAVAASYDGSVVAAGAPWAHGGDDAYRRGVARVYAWDGVYWQQRGDDLVGEENGAMLGFSVALSFDGLRMAVGAPHSGADDRGVTRVYEWVTFEGLSGWVPIGKPIYGAMAYDHAGACLSMNEMGDVIAVSSYGHDKTGDVNDNAGVVRVYRYDAGKSEWKQLGEDLDGEASSDQMGRWNSVSLDATGYVVAAGAWTNDGASSDSSDNRGHARVWKYDGDREAWVQMGADIDGVSSRDHAGVGVSLSSRGLRLAVGAHNNADNGNKAGHVRVFEWDGTTWERLGQVIEGEAAGDKSGFDVSLSEDGSMLAVGAPWNDDGAEDAGHARVWTYNEENKKWQQVGNDIDGEQESVYSGWAVALSPHGGILVVGAPWNEEVSMTVANDGGNVRVFKLNM